MCTEVGQGAALPMFATSPIHRGLSCTHNLSARPGPHLIIISKWPEWPPSPTIPRFGDLAVMSLRVPSCIYLAVSWDNSSTSGVLSHHNRDSSHAWGALEDYLALSPGKPSFQACFEKLNKHVLLACWDDQVGHCSGFSKPASELSLTNTSSVKQKTQRCFGGSIEYL